MSLWAEHLDELNKCFKEPESLACVKTVNEIAQENWKKFTNTDYSPLQGHLLMYPVQVDVDGKVNPLPGHENFPDVGDLLVCGTYVKAVCIHCVVGYVGVPLLLWRILLVKGKLHFVKHF
ncbi:hypothetical protein QUC31_002746 [Theobroma cacao]